MGRCYMLEPLWRRQWWQNSANDPRVDEGRKHETSVGESDTKGRLKRCKLILTRENHV